MHRGTTSENVKDSFQSILHSMQEVSVRGNQGAFSRTSGTSLVFPVSCYRAENPPKKKWSKIGFRAI